MNDSVSSASVFGLVGRIILLVVQYSSNEASYAVIFVWRVPIQLSRSDHCVEVETLSSIVFLSGS